jgi:hypothetical protein
MAEASGSDEGFMRTILGFMRFLGLMPVIGME